MKKRIEKKEEIKVNHQAFCFFKQKQKIYKIYANV